MAVRDGAGVVGRVAASLPLGYEPRVVAEAPLLDVNGTLATKGLYRDGKRAGSIIQVTWRLFPRGPVRAKTFYQDWSRDRSISNNKISLRQVADFVNRLPCSWRAMVTGRLIRRSVDVTVCHID